MKHLGWCILDKNDVMYNTVPDDKEDGIRVLADFINNHPNVTSMEDRTPVRVVKLFWDEEK